MVAGTPRLTQIKGKPAKQSKRAAISATSRSPIDTTAKRFTALRRPIHHPGNDRAGLRNQPDSLGSAAFSRLGASTALAHRLTETEVTAPQRDDLAVSRVIAGLGVEDSCLVRTQAFLEMFQQHRFLVSGSDNQYLFAISQCLVDPRKESQIVVDLAGADGIGLVMQMGGWKIGKNRLLINRIQPQIEDLGEAMIDPDDDVIVNSHGFLSLLQYLEFALMRVPENAQSNLMHVKPDMATSRARNRSRTAKV
jgi:hypothetical protein